MRVEGMCIQICSSPYPRIRCDVLTDACPRRPALTRSSSDLQRRIVPLDLRRAGHVPHASSAGTSARLTPPPTIEEWHLYRQWDNVTESNALQREHCVARCIPQTSLPISQDTFHSPHGVDCRTFPVKRAHRPYCTPYTAPPKTLRCRFLPSVLSFPGPLPVLSSRRSSPFPRPQLVWTR